MLPRLRLQLGNSEIVWETKLTASLGASHQVLRLYSHPQSRATNQLLDEVFVISGIIKVGWSRQVPWASVISRSRDLDHPNITKTESNNCSIIHCFK